MSETQKCLAGGAAEHVRVDKLLIFVILLIDPGFQGNKAVIFVLVEGGVNGTGLGDELVELERQNSVPRSCFHEGFIDRANPVQEIGYGLLAIRRWLAGVLGECVDNFANSKWLAPNGLPFLVFESKLGQVRFIRCRP